MSRRSSSPAARRQPVAIATLPRRRGDRARPCALASLAATAALLALLAPAAPASAEHPGVAPHTKSPGAMPVLATDGYFDVSRLDPATFAIRESRYWQLNILYVLKGEERAVLFDSGSGTRDVHFVATQVTKKPMTVVASHMHYDHIGSMGSFGSVAMVDLPETRAATDGEGWYSPPVMKSLWAFADGFQVTEWWEPGSTVDLGGRSIEVVSIPGHSTDSIALVDRERGYAFVGDFLYGEFPLLANIPGSDLTAYLDSTRRLLTDYPEVHTIFGAHADGRLKRDHLVALERLLADVLERRIRGSRIWWLGWTSSRYTGYGLSLFAAPQG